MKISFKFWVEADKLEEKGYLDLVESFDQIGTKHSSMRSVLYFLIKELDGCSVTTIFRKTFSDKLPQLLRSFHTGKVEKYTFEIKNVFWKVRCTMDTYEL